MAIIDSVPMVLTLDQDHQKILTTACQTITLNPQGLIQAQNTISLLKNVLRPLLPAAGLAAPQIGISQRIFIYSWDRSEAHQIAAINPSFIPLSEEKQLGWEGCFSIILGASPYQLANIQRYKKILATYADDKGLLSTQILDGFAAKVFQHECDHLDGIVNIHRNDAEVMTFQNKDDLIHFMTEIKSKDQDNYSAPYDPDSQD